MIEWEIHGKLYSNCSCAYGCPCQFNALPTHGYCRAGIAIDIDKGHFGDARLDGLKVAFAVAWPGAVHQGRGIMQPIVDERADEAQRIGLLSIITARETDPMATVFAIYTAMCEKIHDPVHTRIDIDLNIPGRLASFDMPGAMTGRGEPIRNPVTKVEHHARIVLPYGMEYGEAEVGRGWLETTGTVAMVLEDTHAHWSELHMNRHGRIH
jgi:hypothetical protein